ncbi:MAG: HNH endonuclease [Planctomycetes bacterium]|nr:HNH endonuclease [Planctomycetota bacterium]
MRPVERGPVPKDDSGDPRAFTRYGQARADLIARIGEYCSYCEMHLDASLAIEHAQPKGHHEDLELEWGNFLLACVNCNSTKGARDINLDDYYWPDVDNTNLVIDYLEGGLVVPAQGLQDHPQRKARAERTIALTGLDKVPGNDPEARDRRWINRFEAWGRAATALRRLRQRDTPELRDQIVDNALDKGFWSVWMAVFGEEKAMRERLLESFPNTASDCFDDELRPIPRPGGSL